MSHGDYKLQQLQDDCNRALINNTYPDDLILEVYEDADKQELITHLLDQHKEETVRLLIDGYELQEVFEQMIKTNRDYQDDYFSELFDKWYAA